MCNNMRPAQETSTNAKDQSDCPCALQCVADCSPGAGLVNSGYVCAVPCVNWAHELCSDGSDVFICPVCEVDDCYNTRTDRICLGTIGLSDVKFVYDIPIFL